MNKQQVIEKLLSESNYKYPGDTAFSSSWINMDNLPSAVYFDIFFKQLKESSVRVKKCIKARQHAPKILFISISIPNKKLNIDFFIRTKQND